MNEPKLFSVIIPTYNYNETLKNCLLALAGQSLEKDFFEVIVVDNGSKVPASTVCRDFDFVRCIDEPKPGSYNARNLGVAHATGEVLAFTDADCVPDKDWLKNARKHLEDNRDHVALGGAIIVASSPVNPTGPELYDKLFAFDQDRFIQELGFAATANLIVRHETFNEVGDFDGTMLSGGDGDWGRRLHAKGHKLIYVDNIRVKHPAISGWDKLLNRHRRMAGGGQEFARRYPEPFNTGGKIRSIRKIFEMFLHPARFDVTLFQVLEAVAIKAVLFVVVRIERVRLILGSQAVR